MQVKRLNKTDKYYLKKFDRLTQKIPVKEPNDSK